jgi:hypothetical protein
MELTIKGYKFRLIFQNIREVIFKSLRHGAERRALARPEFPAIVFCTGRLTTLSKRSLLPALFGNAKCSRLLLSSKLMKRLIKSHLTRRHQPQFLQGYACPNFFLAFLCKHLSVVRPDKKNGCTVLFRFRTPCLAWYTHHQARIALVESIYLFWERRTMSWVSIVDNAMIASGYVKQAAVFTKDGFLAASSPGFTVCHTTLNPHYFGTISHSNFA